MDWRGWLCAGLAAGVVATASLPASGQVRVRVRGSGGFMIDADGNVYLPGSGGAPLWYRPAVRQGGFPIGGYGAVRYRNANGLGFYWYRSWTPYPLDGSWYPAAVTGEGGVDPRLLPGGELTDEMRQELPQGPAGSAGAAEDPATPVELARLALRLGRWEEAVGLFREHLDTDWEDTESLRLFGVALLASGKPAEAMGPVRLAHQITPALGESGIDPSMVGGEGELRKLMLRAVRQANELESASAWLLATVLVQGEGRRDVARKFLGRAEEAGLEAEVVSWLETGLGEGQ